jgi:hypothetical protein
MQYFQETDSKIVFSMPNELSYPRPSESTYRTTGGSPKRYFLPLPDESSLVRKAWTVTRKVENKAVAQEARNLLIIIQEMIDSFQLFGFDVGYLPSLDAFVVDDGSILIEWIYSNFRIGFNIECNPQDSGWFLVSNRQLGDIGASGRTFGLDINKLFLWLFNFVLSNIK